MAQSLENGSQEVSAHKMHPIYPLKNILLAACDIGGGKFYPGFEFGFERNGGGDSVTINAPFLRAKRTNKETPRIIDDGISNPLIELPHGYPILMERTPYGADDTRDVALWVPEIPDNGEVTIIKFPKEELADIDWQGWYKREHPQSERPLMAIYIATEVVVRDPQPESQEKVLVKFK